MRPDTAARAIADLRPPSPEQLLAGKDDPMLATARGARGLLLALGLIGFVAALAVWFFWKMTADHFSAAGALEARGAQVLWTVDETNWRTLGDTTVDGQRHGFNKTGLRDSDLAVLPKLHKLLEVRLEASPQITDAGLAALGRVTTLEILILSSDIGVQNVFQPQITNAGLAHLRGLTRLQKLSLYGCPITDDGLAHVAALKNLRTLDLEGTLVSDAGMARLVALTRLEHLNLTNTELTDAGLRELHALPALTQLDVPGTKVTARGLWELMRARPGINLYHDLGTGVFEGSNP